MRIKKMKKDSKAAAGVSPAKAEGVCQAAPITCTVKFWNGKWIFDVPGEGTAVLRDRKQPRVVASLLLNMGKQLVPDDTEQAASTGPIVVHDIRRSVDEPAPSRDEIDALSQQSEDEVSLEADDGSSDEGNEEEGSVDFDGEATFTSGADPDLLMLYGLKQSRHTGDAGDYRMVEEIDRRVSDLDDGIAAAKARGHAKKAAALYEERVELRKDRGWYRNPITGKLRPFYSKEVDDKAKRCRMWILRGLRTLAAKGLPKAAASLMVAIERGMAFTYTEQPGYAWVVTPPPSGSLPNLGKPDDRHEGASEVAA